MDIFKLIHKIRKLSVDDKLALVKKGMLIAIVGVLAVFLLISGLNFIFKAFNSKDNSTQDLYEDVYIPPKQEYIEDEAKFEDPTSKQSKEFNEYNCLEFSNLTQKDGIVSIDIKNTSTSTLKNISVELYNSSNIFVARLSVPSKLKPNEVVNVEGFANEEAIVTLYTYLKDDKFITINLSNKSALTEENYEGEVL